MKILTRLVLRYAGWLVLLGSLLAVAGTRYTIELYKTLRTDFQELLPLEARSMVDLKEISSRLLSIDSLGVLVFTQDSAAGKRFVKALALEMEKQPHSVVQSVEYKIDTELKFFQDRQALYMDLDDLKKVRTYLEDRIDYEKELYNPLNIFAENLIPEPSLDFLMMQKKYEGKSTTYTRFPDGYYATPDGKKRVVLVYKPGGTDMDVSIALQRATKEAIRKLNPKSYAPDLEIHLTGGIQDGIEEFESLIEDLEVSTAIVSVLVGIGMWLFFRNMRATLALLLSLLMGTLWTFGVAYFFVGSLNANSAFMGSIVIGNGINFGIIFLARYLEERRTNHSNSRAIRISMIHTATATWTAAAAAALSYGSLVMTSFRGFRQFGIIGLIGMMFCWMSAFTILPALLTLFDKISPLVKKGTLSAPSVVAESVARWIQKYARWIWALSLIATVVSMGTFKNLSKNVLETEFSKLRSRISIEQGSSYYSRYTDEIFQRYMSPLAFLPHTHQDALKIATALKEKQKLDGKDSLIASVQTLADFIPKNQLEKIATLREIQRLLPPKLLKRLAPEDKKRVDTLLSPASFIAIEQNNLPPLILSKFTEKDGTIGRLVLVEPPIWKHNWDGESLTGLVNTLRKISDEVRPGIPLAGILPITADIVTSVAHDGPLATTYALIAVIVLVVILFRNVEAIGLTLLALFMGMLWLSALILGFGLKINFFNFIVLPITFGIGVDYGVNIFHRFKEEKEAGILAVVKNTGGAVALCSFTTVVGYMSLLIANNQGFVSFGGLAVAGELTCVVAAVISLPAFLVLRAQKKEKSLR